MNCVRWSMGDVSLHGMGTSSVCPASVLGVTHVPGLNCYLCVWPVPLRALTLRFNGPAVAEAIFPTLRPRRSALRPSRFGSTEALVEGLLRYTLRNARGLDDPEATAAPRSRSRHRPQGRPPRA